MLMVQILLAATEGTTDKYIKSVVNQAIFTMLPKRISIVILRRKTNYLQLLQQAAKQNGEGEA